MDVSPKVGPPNASTSRPLTDKADTGSADTPHMRSGSAGPAAERIDAVFRALEAVTDPEIPVLNVVEMGIIADVRISDHAVTVEMTPTFAGCPALDVIRRSIIQVLHEIGETDVRVNVVFDPPWTSDRLRDSAREKLSAFGIAPPGLRCAATGMPDLEQTPCPYCQSTDTEVESIFGPTLCRSIHYCRHCLQSFEHFKTV